ncbi:MAG: DUF5131 family protein, partial [Hyphomicrobiaceae bacterium]
MWKEPLKWDRKCCESGTRQRVFCASLADVFEDWNGPVRRHDGCTMWECSQCGIWRDGAVPEVQKVAVHCYEHGPCKPLTVQAIRRRLFALIDQTPNLDWLLVTKRPENIVRMWPTPLNSPCRLGDGSVSHDFIGDRCVKCKGGNRQNVWLLTSVENQEQADKRIPELLKCRDLAPVLGVSFEPLLESIDLHSSFPASQGPIDATSEFFDDSTLPIDWGIIGGE